MLELILTNRILIPNTQISPTENNFVALGGEFEVAPDHELVCMASEGTIQTQPQKQRPQK